MLSRTPDIPPFISPLAEAEKINRPLWSVMIPVYNCSNYLKETLESVLQQVMDEKIMQVEVVDDASSDADIQLMVEEIGKGRIGYYRQTENVGSLRNFETCINRAKGKLIHLLHGDDTVLPGFYKKIQFLFDEYPGIGAAFCRYYYINENSETLYPSDDEMPHYGILENWLQRIAVRQLIQTPSIVVKREVYEKLGSFYAVHYGEDWEMWVRVAANYPMAYFPDVLAAYRQHNSSITAQYFLSAENIRDLKKVMYLNSLNLPAEIRAEVKKESEKFYAHYAISTARMLWHKYKNKPATKAQIKEALSMYNSPRIATEILKLKIKFLLNIR